MIVSLLPLLQFGSMHGIVVVLPKWIAKKNDNSNELFWSYNSFSHLIQIMSVIFIFFFDISMPSYIVIIIILNYILSKYSENIRILLNANLKFEKVNLIKIVDQIVRPISILSIFIIFKSIESIFFGQLLTTLAAFFVSLSLVKFKFNFIGLERYKNNIKTIYQVGFFVYLIWAIDIIFRTADKWFISQFYSLEELAEYGFASSMAMNIWLLSMSFFAPYSQILYKHVAENNFVDVQTLIRKTNIKLYILLLFTALFTIVLYPILLETIVQKYHGTELLFSVLVISAIFLSINNMYIYYMISNNLHFVLLKYQLFVLLLNIFLNTIFVFYHLEIIFYSYSTIITLGIYFFLVRWYYSIDLSRKLKRRELDHE